MKLVSEYLIKGLELCCGVIAGVLTWKLSGEESYVAALLSIIVGLLATLVFTLLIESFRQQSDLKDIKSTYDNLIDLICQGRSHSEERLTYILKYGVVTFADNNMPNVWRDLLWNVQKTYYATNHIKSSEIYDQNWADAALAIQKAKAVGENVDIRKIFIAEDAKELDELKSSVHKQLDAGINIRLITMSEIENSSALRRSVSELESIDFGVFDDSSVFLWKLEDRSFVGGEVVFKVDQVKHHKDFFNQLFLEAHPPERYYSEKIISYDQAS